MSALVPALIVFVVLAGVYFLMLGTLRRNGYVPKTWRGVRSFRMPDEARGISRGIVAAVAMMTVFRALGVTDGLVAVLCSGALAIITLVGRRTVGAIFDLLAFGAIIATVVGMLSPNGCSGTTSGWTPLIAAVLLVCGLVAYVLGLVFRWGRPIGAALVLFALLDIVDFVAVPFGVPLIAEHPWYGPVILVIVAAVGFVGSIFPGIVLGFGALGVSLAGIVVAAGWGSPCSGAGVWWPVVGLVVFCVVYVVGSRVRRR
jgi:hypothetical protein